MEANLEIPAGTRDIQEKLRATATLPPPACLRVEICGGNLDNNTVWIMRFSKPRSRRKVVAISVKRWTPVGQAPRSTPGRSQRVLTSYS